MRYIYERGKPRRVMHIALTNAVGELTGDALCGIDHAFNTTINAPFGLGRKVCKACLHATKEKSDE